MPVFDRYILKNVFFAFVFVTGVLTVVIFLSQSLRFLELVLSSGASGSAFWILTLLALPRFFEVIGPLAIMVATLFIYNRLNSDSEIASLRSAGFSPMRIARPALLFASVVTVLLWGVTMWAAPKSLSSMQEMRQIIKAQFSSILFREGVFNQVGSGLTIYIRTRAANGDLSGLMIHDSRSKSGAYPSTITAKKGTLVATEDGQQVIVFDGSRQEYDPVKKILNRLDFNRYTIDLPDGGPVRQRWREPDERTIFELLRPNAKNKRDLDSVDQFRIEVHRRIISPLLTFVFTLISCCALLLGPADRRGQGRRIIFAICFIIVLQGLFLGLFSMIKQNTLFLPILYLSVLLPLFSGLFFLSSAGEKMRRRLLYLGNKSHASTSVENIDAGSAIL